MHKEHSPECHKTALNKYKNLEIIPYTFFDGKTMKLEDNHKKKSGKTTSTWRLNNMLLNTEWIYQEIKEEIKKKYMGTNENENTRFKTFGMQQKRS